MCLFYKNCTKILCILCLKLHKCSLELSYALVTNLSKVMCIYIVMDEFFFVIMFITSELFAFSVQKMQWKYLVLSCWNLHRHALV